MLFYIDRCVDTLFIFDLFLSFIRPYENKVGDTVTQIPSILRNYFSWWEPRKDCTTILSRSARLLVYLY